LFASAFIFRIWFGDEPDIGVVAAAYGIPLLLAIMTYYSHSRERPPSSQNECRSCRYNLTGNISGICPECGSPITPPAKTIDPKCAPPVQPPEQRFSL